MGALAGTAGGTWFFKRQDLPACIDRTGIFLARFTRIRHHDLKDLFSGFYGIPLGILLRKDGMTINNNMAF